MSEFISKDEFWELMCEPEFRRVSLLTGTSRGVEYICLNPPSFDECLDKAIEAVDRLEV